MFFRRRNELKDAYARIRQLEKKVAALESATEITCFYDLGDLAMRALTPREALRDLADHLGVRFIRYTRVSDTGVKPIEKGHEDD